MIDYSQKYVVKRKALELDKDDDDNERKMPSNFH